MVIPLAHALVSIHPDPVREAVVVRGDEAALARGHVLGAVQAERGVAEAARTPAAVERAVRLAGILDDRETVAIRDRLDRVHVGDHAEQAHRADRSGSRSDGGFDSAGVHEVRVRLDVDEDGAGAGEQD